MSIPPLPSGLTDTAQNQCANALHSFAIGLLRRASRGDQQSGISPERLSLLSILVFAGEQTIGELAAMEFVSAAAVSRTVTGLEKSGLVTRTRSESDARVVTVKATAKGQRLMQAARKRRVAAVAGQIEALNQRECKALIALIENLNR